LATGEKYEGHWRDDQIHGPGTFTWTNGEKYVGNWVNDQRNGPGTFTWTNGEKYVGNWVNDQRNGRGTMTYADGSKYAGLWVDGKENGTGKMICSRYFEYVGEWADGVCVCTEWCKKTYDDGRTYAGGWVDGKENGKGTMTYPDGTKYEGMWKDGVSAHLNERSCDENSCETSIYPILEPQSVSYEPSAHPLPVHQEQAYECVVCMDSEANYACIPCGHKCLCSNSDCSSLKDCPLCRQEITGTYRIY
jgi:hypothetical protein